MRKEERHGDSLVDMSATTQKLVLLRISANHFLMVAGVNRISVRVRSRA